MRWLFWLILTLVCSAPLAGADYFQARHLSVERLVHWLSYKYPQLRFVAEDDGFEVSGDSPRMKAMAADLQRLDVDDSVGEWVEIKNGERDEIKSLLVTLVPEVIFELSDENQLLIIGSPRAVEQALELIHQLDQPLDPVLVECRVVHDSPELERRLVGATAGGPRVQRWPEESPKRLGLRTAELDNIDFLGPNQLLAHQSLEGQSGTELGFSLNSLRVSVAANVKADGYLVMKISFGTEVHQYTTDARMRGGQTLALAGWSTADELLLVTVKILPKPED